MSNLDHITIIDTLFIIRLAPLMLAGFVATRAKDYIGMIIAGLYICVTSVNYWFGNPALNAVFSTPLVFLTAWYIIKPDLRNRRNQRLRLNTKVKKIKLVKEK